MLLFLLNHICQIRIRCFLCGIDEANNLSKLSALSRRRQGSMIVHTGVTIISWFWFNRFDTRMKPNCGCRAIRFVKEWLLRDDVWGMGIFLHHYLFGGLVTIGQVWQLILNMKEQTMCAYFVHWGGRSIFWCRHGGFGIRTIENREWDEKKKREEDRRQETGDEKRGQNEGVK